MEVVNLNWLEEVLLVTKSKGKHGLYMSRVCHEGTSKEEFEAEFASIQKDVPFLAGVSPGGREPLSIAFMDLLVEGRALLLFDTEEERDAHYWQVSGDDTGGHVYAITISPEGKALNENT